VNQLLNVAVAVTGYTKVIGLPLLIMSAWLLINFSLPVDCCHFYHFAVDGLLK